MVTVKNLQFTLSQANDDIRKINYQLWQLGLNFTQCNNFIRNCEVINSSWQIYINFDENELKNINKIFQKYENTKRIS